MGIGVIKMILFETRRTYIREFQAQDIDLFMEYRNNQEWMIYQGFKDKSKEEYESALLVDTDINKGNQFAIINKELGELIGDIYLKKEHNTFWIGYTINPRYKRQGIAYEVIQTLIR